MTIDDITPNNPIVVDRLSEQGYCLVSNEYIHMCNTESIELAKIKVVLRDKDKYIKELEAKLKEVRT